ncbi:MAG: HAMP domain-containing histidine kinase [Kineosporiaceae bacterium]|nr:HAMP domain-containing histidine kinase [Kineosporiaceae bacterium]MBK8074556.1 HAMP domain-containing histidine kinase [Kineosporiaceae bacterium]
MRRRLTFLVAATTSAVVVAFLVPMTFLLRALADQQVLTGSIQRQLEVLYLVGSTDAAALPAAVDSYLKQHQPVGTSTTLYLPDGRALGVQVRDDAGVSQAIRVRNPFNRTQDGALISYRVLVVGQSSYVVRDAVSNDVRNAGVLRRTLVIGALAIVLMAAAALAADRLARRVTEPIQEVAQAADAMREGSLDVRVTEAGMPEVVTLAKALNRLAERVGRLLSAERDAVADLSHRLRTPVTALRLDTEMITDPDVSERLRTHITQLERTVDAIVHDARRPTRADATGSCDAAKVVRERVAFWSALAEEQDRPLRTAVPERPLRAKVSANDLSDVVDVLLDNVFAHTDDGVPIEVWVVPRADGAIVLTVEDGGPGLPAGDIVSRGSSGAGSTGLGLDIARRAAMASGGWLELGQSRLGGALVRVVLGRAAT